MESLSSLFILFQVVLLFSITVSVQAWSCTSSVSSLLTFSVASKRAWRLPPTHVPSFRYKAVAAGRSSLKSHPDETFDTKNASLLESKNVTGVTLKLAFDLQWAVADLSEEKSERFTSPESLDLVHRLRRESQGVLVGRTTVERDDCSLTVRRVPLLEEGQPTRIVVDPALSLLTLTDPPYTLLRDGLPTLIYYDKDKVLSPPDSLPVSVTLVGLSSTTSTASTSAGSSSQILSATALCRDLQERGMPHVMVEGGPATARHFLTSRCIDRAICIFAPLTFQTPQASGINYKTLTEAGLECLGNHTNAGGDVVEYWSRPELPWPRARLTDWP